MFDDLQPILRGAERLLLEIVCLDHDGPSIVIVHRYRVRVLGAKCQTGEEVAQVLLSFGRYTIVHLTLGPRLLFDHLARTKHVPESAAQIAAAMRASEFYRRHGVNSGVLMARKFSHSCIKEYVKRIRKALAIALQENSLPLDAARVLSSEIVGKEVRYRLRASVQWVHTSELDARLPRVWGYD